MFTGIITHTGKIKNIEIKPNQDLLFSISFHEIIDRKLDLGASVACNGVCLTIIKNEKSENETILFFEVSKETLSKTNFSKLKIGDKINIEFSLRIGEELGGHLVSGHIDGIAKLVNLQDVQTSKALEFEIENSNLAKYIARKGSICLNGVSLTVNEVNKNNFKVNIIPHSLAVTNLSDLKIGDSVNLEIDMIARYLERLNEK